MTRYLFSGLLITKVFLSICIFESKYKGLFGFFFLSSFISLFLPLSGSQSDID